MERFYFTFGSSEHFPYQCGWVEVRAGDIHEAIRKFRGRFPDRHEGVLNCSDYYTEARFQNTEMAASGNMGKRCHEVIK